MNYQPRPKFMTIKAWVAFSGVSRSATYLALGAGSLVARKAGRATLIDVDSGIAWLNNLPPARIGQKSAA